MSDLQDFSGLAPVKSPIEERAKFRDVGPIFSAIRSGQVLPIDSLKKKMDETIRAAILTAGEVSTVLVLHQVPDAGEAEALSLWVGTRSCPRINPHSGACRIFFWQGGGQKRNKCL